MTTEQLSQLLGWMSLINLGVFLISTAVLIAARRTITGIHSRLFGLDEQDLGRAYFQYLGQYKIAIILFNVTPYLALKMMT
ncbi:MAG: DUF6868 family protein [Candidatus Competibacterales bacterium]